MNKLSKKVFKNFVSQNRRLLAGLLSFILFVSLSIEPTLARDSPQFHILDNRPQKLSSSDTLVTPLPKSLDNRSEFADFVNSFFEQQLSKSNIPGAVISVVKDGEIFFTNGYGYANLEEKIPADADTSLFRVASVSKLITATAAMQLYERGAIDLDRDVNEYLED